MVKEGMCLYVKFLLINSGAVSFLKAKLIPFLLFRPDARKEINLRNGTVSLLRIRVKKLSSCQQHLPCFFHFSFVKQFFCISMYFFFHLIRIYTIVLNYI